MSTNSIRKSLTDIVEKLEGQQITGKNLDIRQALTRIADAIDGGGYGGGDFRVTFSVDPETQDITCDKTMAEIRAAVLSGKRPYGMLSREEGDFMFFDLVSSWTPDEEIRTDTYCFQNIIGSEYIQITMHDFEDTGIDVTTGEFQEV